ncbi:MULTISPECIES: DUF4183 domain-containing protein [Paenibacillus]|uniref:DUF4183 domain-containing protein n=1 Tax=Paenibacillus naphthalenovorans TaxID=162209 RepID=A0A0U2MXQ3_9BACL|nr:MULTISPECIES: DUF4183 domain-containing protein [Paenibacillus]ALS22975.1 hypothetical protein IJ22_26020 [Paenibacillus naphthalenovorans]NTZ17431.1 DUF4183 domain-containing protein [Paenibacillus sp. JMULE4]GCL71963.1 DUF4183 domain-containing protein [Paenibacillus naphthalenovorans]SDI43727.1 protein of unknown function [Paenibacillus naphthalenovorans]
MALRILKIFASATTTTTTETVPTVERFFYEVAAQVTAGNTLTIAVGDFETDAGVAATSLPALATNNSYVNVFVNGILVMNNLVTYTDGAAGQLEIEVPVGSEPIEATTPVVLEVVNFAPSSTSTTTVIT